MNMGKRLAPLTLLFLSATPGVTTTTMAGEAPAHGTARMQVEPSDAAIMYLGKIEVQGQKNIIKTLQAIKVALQQPYSTDSKLANVVVCRLQDEAGSHIKQWLTCGTNRILAENRDALHTAMTTAASDTGTGRGPGGSGSVTCVSRACYTEVFSVLNETLNSQRGQYLHTLVNGPGLRSLLQKIPYPAPQQVVAPVSTAGSQHP